MAPRFNTKSNVKMAKLPTFDRETSKVLGFIIVYRFYIRIRIRNISVEK